MKSLPVVALAVIDARRDPRLTRDFIRNRKDSW